MLRRLINTARSLMSKAGKNELALKLLLCAQFKIDFNESKRWNDPVSGVEISVDLRFETTDFDVLIEVDSGNMAKLIVGQYTLLNQLYIKNAKMPLFVVVHYYNQNTNNPYNPHRTTKNLSFVKNSLFPVKGIPFAAFNIASFASLLNDLNTIEQLNNKFHKEILGCQKKL